ncbi:MAG: hypothetical protein JSS22_00405 [Proteobacteria bacterium]|nr:hypothetical protein [Pseudomonadota bacterium]
MNFRSADPSIVRSVKQRELLNVWLRAIARPGSLPRAEDFQPEHIQDEMPDLMRFDVIGSGDLARFLITYEGTRLTTVYDSEAVDPLDRINRFLDDAIGPKRYQRVYQSYHACVTGKRPTYSVASVYDRQGRQVSYERLLLPFGRPDTVEQIVGSYKAISIDGGFQIRGLMGLDVQAEPEVIVRALIDRDTAGPTPGPAGDDVIEMV